MKRTRLRHQSAKHRQRADECRDIRAILIAKHGKCMICGHDPFHPRLDIPVICWKLDAHEIARGKNRSKALGKPFATLIVCRLCHEEELSSAAKWPEARQLALLKLQAPEDYDLAAYNALVNPKALNRITEAEVDAELEGLK